MRDNYQDVFLFIPEKMHIVHIAEGSGDSFDEADIKAGYCDYIYYDVYDMENNFAEDGGMIMLKEFFRYMYESTESCIEEVLQFHYDCIPVYRILKKEVNEA